MKQIIHLDCTLRDGGYYNNWNFENNLINEYLLALEKIKIDYVEIGFRFFDGTRNKGNCAYTSERFLNSLKIPKKVKIGIMVNASDLIEHFFKKKLPIEKNFVKKKKSKISLIRVACHFHEIKDTKKIIKKLKSMGYEIGINLMQISEKNNYEIIQAIKEIKKINPKVLYFADSLGSLDSDKTLKIVKILKKFWKKDIGIHTHDNMQNALRNSLTALNQGVKWIDTTVTGMGRGPGNTKTEIAILEFEKLFNKKVDILPLMNLIKKYFIGLQNKYSWGTNPYYYLAGIWGIHPSFVQEMLFADISSTSILKNLKNLKNIGGQKFSKDLINRDEQFYYGKTVGSWNANKILENKEVLILGSGPNLLKSKFKVERFIKKNKPIVFLINNNLSIEKKFIDYRIACHTMRILLDCKYYNKIKSPLIIPYKRFSERVKNSLRSISIRDFGIEVRKGTFKFEKTSCVIPNSLAFSYALGVVNSGNAKKIYIAGFDGYKKGDIKKVNMDQTLKIYNSSKKDKCKIYSLTKTTYKVIKSYL